MYIYIYSVKTKKNDETLVIIMEAPIWPKSFACVVEWFPNRCRVVMIWLGPAECNEDKLVCRKRPWSANKEHWFVTRQFWKVQVQLSWLPDFCRVTICDTIRSHRPVSSGSDMFVEYWIAHSICRFKKKKKTKWNESEPPGNKKESYTGWGWWNSSM